MATIADLWTPEQLRVAVAAVAQYNMEREAERRLEKQMVTLRSLSLGDVIRFYTAWDARPVIGTVERVGSTAGWANVAGVQTRFEAFDIVSVEKTGEYRTPEKDITL